VVFPDPERSHSRYPLEISIGGQHHKVVTNTELGEERGNGSDRYSLLSAFVSNGRSIYVVLAVRNNERQHTQAAHNPVMGFRTRKALKQFL
jgi:hypothetical protein